MGCLWPESQGGACTHPEAGKGIHGAGGGVSQDRLGGVPVDPGVGGFRPGKATGQRMEGGGRAAMGAALGGETPM